MSTDDLDLLRLYEAHASSVLLPFWMRALDEKNGGVYTCFNNEGTQLLSTDKYTWSQGRFVWVLSRLSSLCSQGVLAGSAERYLETAGKTVGFLRRNAILENGNCAFLLTETGEKKEIGPGRGFDTSIYADCFVASGFAEYARVARDAEILEQALKLYDRIEERLKRGNVRSDPYPIPDGYEPHSVSMILLNVTQEVSRASRSLGHPRGRELRRRSLSYAETIMDRFRQEDGTVVEMLSKNGSSSETVLARHLNPGHTLESMWFVMAVINEAPKSKYLRQAVEAVKRAFQVGWDDDYGGLFRFVDRAGGKPAGAEIGDPYERLILDTWDTKLWWPHSEALYTLLLAHELSGDEELLSLYRRTHEYVFRTFPNPDGEVGEWIQIRDRAGRPVEKVVALPVKDPYHVLRNVLLIIELLSRKLERKC